MKGIEYMEKLTIHGALRELKTLDSRINRATSELTIIGCKKSSSDTDYTTGRDVKKFETEARAGYDKVKALIERRDAIKRAIILSNATTHVQIDNVDYTVAEAIDKKSSIEYERDLLANMKADVGKAKAIVSRNNSKMEDNLNKQIENLTAGNATKVESMQDFANMYRADNSWTLIDPLNAEEIIDKLESKITKFLDTIDEALSVSNAITTIII